MSNTSELVQHCLAEYKRNKNPDTYALLVNARDTLAAEVERQGIKTGYRFLDDQEGTGQRGTGSGGMKHIKD